MMDSIWVKDYLTSFCFSFYVLFFLFINLKFWPKSFGFDSLIFIPKATKSTYNILSVSIGVGAHPAVSVPLGASAGAGAGAGAGAIQLETAPDITKKSKYIIVPYHDDESI